MLRRAVSVPASHIAFMGREVFRLLFGENQKKCAAVQLVCRNELESVRNETDSRSRLVFGRVPAQNQKIKTQNETKRLWARLRSPECGGTQ
jgi:hypothetical protein